MFRAIAAIKKGKDLVGLRLQFVFPYENIRSDSQAVKDVPLQQVTSVIRDANSNVSIKFFGKKIDLTDGSIESLPVLDANTLQLVANNVVIILAKLTSGGQAKGYRICDYMGQQKDVGIRDVLIFSDMGFANAKVVNRDNSRYISAIKGEFHEIKIDNLLLPFNPANNEKLLSSNSFMQRFFVRAVKHENSRSVDYFYRLPNNFGLRLQIDKSNIDENTATYNTPDLQRNISEMNKRVWSGSYIHYQELSGNRDNYNLINDTFAAKYGFKRPFNIETSRTWKEVLIILESIYSLPKVEDPKELLTTAVR
jgi:hypothetical protein